MPKYNEICALSYKIENGKEIGKNQLIRENVNLTEQEAKRLNDNPYLTGCKYELMEEKKTNKKTYAQMNAKERAEYKAEKANQKK